MENNTNNTLSAEVIKDIQGKAEEYINSYEDEGTEYSAYIAGATEYALKLIKCDKANSALQEENRRLLEQIKKAKRLLKRVQNNFSGTVEMSERKSDRRLFAEIKTFLDGKQ
jgi:hypothetical protein